MYNLPSDIKSNIYIEGDTTCFSISNFKSYDNFFFRYIRFLEDKIKDKLKYGYIVYLDICVGISYFYIPDNEDVNGFIQNGIKFEIKNWDDFMIEFEDFINKPDNIYGVSNFHFTDITFKYYYSKYDTFKYKLYSKIKKKKNFLVINNINILILLIKSTKRYKDLN